MPLYATREPEKEFELPPANTYIGTCYRIVDLGTQLSPFKDDAGRPKRHHQIMISWELNENMSDGKPFSISRFYTLSLHEKSALCKDLEAWRGKQFTEEELKKFDISNILGKSCMIGVSHKQKENGKAQAVVTAVLTLPKGITAAPLVNEKQCLLLIPGEFDHEGYAKLSDKMRGGIELSPEYAECMKGVPNQGEYSDGHPNDAPAYDIPFDDREMQF